MRDDDAALSAVLPALLVGAGALVATVAASSRAPSNGPNGTTDDDGETWVWPLPSWSGYPPAISDGFGTWRTDASGKRIQHMGVDLMYARRGARDQVAAFPPRTAHGSAGSFMPDAVPVLAVRDASVWSAAKTSRGYAVVLDHGPPWATFYQHMSEMFVEATQRGRSGQRVRAGDVLGYVGADPLDGEGLMHLHFEVWYRGGPSAAIDPTPLMRSWLVLPMERRRPVRIA
jgi:murein DD-endopeptidase MepM/ murein hydrolase activator NlpD